MTVLKAKMLDGSWVEVGGVGPGVAAGGTTGQILSKTSGADYATGWVDPPAASSPSVPSWVIIS